MRAKSQRPRSKVAANNGKWRSWRRTKLKNTKKKKRKIIEKRIQCFCLLPRLVHSPTFSAPAHRKMASRNANLCSLLETSKRQQERRRRRTGGAWQQTTKVDWLAKHLKLHQVCPAAWKKSSKSRGGERRKEEKGVRERREKGEGKEGGEREAPAVELSSTFVGLFKFARHTARRGY